MQMGLRGPRSGKVIFMISTTRSHAVVPANDIELPLADDAKAAGNIRVVATYIDSSADWIDLALSAVDQAGIDLRTQQTIWALLGRDQ